MTTTLITEAAIRTLLARDDSDSIRAALAPLPPADLWKSLPEAERDALLPGLAAAEREDVRRLASYPEGRAVSCVVSRACWRSLASVLAQRIARQHRRGRLDRRRARSGLAAARRLNRWSLALVAGCEPQEQGKGVPHG
jgi:Mg/Co/Ni transporter MgtE